MFLSDFEWFWMVLDGSGWFCVMLKANRAYYPDKDKDKGKSNGKVNYFVLISTISFLVFSGGP